MEQYPHAPPRSKPTHNKPSTSDLLSSAKALAEAAKASMNHESSKVDKGRVAGAAADLLGATSHYGKLEEKGVGKYVEKAETYLHQYHSSHSTQSTTTAHSTTSGTTTHSGGDPHPGKSGYGDYIKMAEGFMKKQSGDSHSAAAGGGGGAGAGAGADLPPSGGSHSSSGGGYGDYIKMAEGFLKNQSGGGGAHSSGGGSGGGYGDYVKMAEGFLKKR